MRSPIREAAAMPLTMLPPSPDTVQRAVRCAVTSPVVHAEATPTVVTLRGEADVSTRPALADVLSRVIAHGAGDVVIDLAPVTFIDTATVRVLATGQQLLDRTGRALTFRSPSRLAVRVLDLFGLTDQIETRPVPQS
jgi:anti-anti-sigma factor